jgi:2-amino-4-hydroxy-6-hydroxymethyldihydropteridine diphosphokinase
VLKEERFCTAFVALGSNLGQPLRQLKRALVRIHALPLTHIQAVSAGYLSPALPNGSEQLQPDYLNAVAQLRTALPPAALLNALHRIEALGGRRRLQHWAARTLDLDLLAYEQQESQQPHLKLPHPEAQHRAFVLYPWADIAPDWHLHGQTLQAWRQALAVKPPVIVHTSLFQP